MASLVMSSVSVCFAEPAQNAVTDDSAAANDQVVVTLQVVRPKGNPSDIQLVDYSERPAPVQQAPEPPPAPAQSEAKPADQALATVAEAPRPSQTAPEHKPAAKPVKKPAAEPVKKPAPAPAVKKPVVAPKPKSPAPKSSIAKPKAPAPKAKAAPKPNPQKQSIISRAVKGAASLASRAVSWIGTRYVWGGLSKAGVDCSGLTRMIYKSVGVHLPHNARQQFKLGRSVAKSALQPGDLVFFNTSGPITHVGIYIGSNKFVHAANPRRGVRTDSLGSSYYHKRYAGARRYI